MRDACSSFGSLHLQVLGISLCTIGLGLMSPPLLGQETAVLSGAVVSEKQAGIADVQVTITDNQHREHPEDAHR